MADYTSKGSQALAETATRRGHNQRMVAQTLGVAPPLVSRLLSGKRRASLAVQRAAEEAYGIPAGWWAHFINEAPGTKAA